MTLNELLTRARCIQATHHTLISGNEAGDFAGAVLDLLSELAPCGLEQPEIIRYRGHGTVDMIRIPASWAADVEAVDARHMMRMLARAADSVEGESE